MQRNGGKLIFFFENLDTLRDVLPFSGNSGRYCSIRFDFLRELSVPFVPGSFEGFRSRFQVECNVTGTSLNKRVQ